LYIFSDLKMYGRFTWGLRSYLRHTLTLEEAKAIIQKRMAEREENFLRLVRKGIFGYPKSPYLPLLRLARCEMGDIEKMVRGKGLEGTLRALREAGVYVTFEEFKGREPILRQGESISVKHNDFNNPFLSHYYKAETGGTTQAGTRVEIDLEHLEAETPRLMVSQDAHDLLDIPTAIWFGILPDPTGIIANLTRVPFRNVPQKWFSPITNRDLRPSIKNQLATRYIIFIGRLLGVPISWPESVSLENAIVVARWVADILKTHNKCLIITHVSKALRLCIAAQEEGLDLTGLVLWGGGEPPTFAKVQEMQKTGAHWIPSYYWTEVGLVGQGCAKPADINDLHFFKDRLALIQSSRKVPGSEITVNAFYFTTLLLTAPKLMLNVESDDYGVIEHRSCGCTLESYGFTDHLRHIQSYQKLTGEGVTLVGSEMVYILENVLPARFGGSPIDYQLLEEEDEQGFTRLSLLVSPRIKIKDKMEVINAVLEALKHSSVSAELAGAIWKQAKTFQVKQMEPILTVRGKLMPLHLAKRFPHST